MVISKEMNMFFNFILKWSNSSKTFSFFKVTSYVEDLYVYILTITKM